ncbi:hypothetical protein SD80_012590 [Scytonema tolypothrichoides VB-61278]|nr:hypothetical protein SD80_012590 [Scytonema tolypothrichoides VB-61278]
MGEAGFILLVGDQDTNSYTLLSTTQNTQEGLDQLRYALRDKIRHKLVLFHSIPVESLQQAREYFTYYYQQYHRNGWMVLTNEAAVLVAQSMEYYKNNQASLFKAFKGVQSGRDDGTGGIIAFAVIVLAMGIVFTFFSQPKYPEYADCLSYGGGSACHRLLNKK